MEGAAPTPPAAGRWHLVLRLVGLAVAAAAIWFCARAIGDAWSDVRPRLVDVRWGWLGAALAASAAGMTGLGLLWWRCLRTFGVRASAPQAVAWHFGGELGKYLPGGVWAVLGRGELAHRGAGVPRATGYATTLIAYTCMCAAAALTCGVLAPVAAERGGGLGWGWALLALLPVGLAAVHPAVLGPVLRAARRASRQRLALDAPDWPAMVRLVARAVPTWLLVGTAAAFVTEAFGFDQHPVRVAFAAVAAWIVGFLAVPVPAGAGVREVVFVVLCGLPAGPATAVAAVARLLLLVVDGVGGAAALVATRTARTAP